MAELILFAFGAGVASGIVLMLVCMGVRDRSDNLEDEKEKVEYL